MRDSICWCRIQIQTLIRSWRQRRVYSKDWRRKNPGYKEQWRKNNYVHYLAQARKHTRTRLQRKLNINEIYTEQDERFTINLFSDRCICFGSTNRLEIDHHYPLSKGLGLARDNAVLLCKTCNISKHDKMPEDFYTPSKLKDIEYLLALAAAEDLIL